MIPLSALIHKPGPPVARVWQGDTTPRAMSNYEARFGGVSRLVAAEGLERLRRAHVCVIGIGGVGSWAAEALARSGLGALTLVDLDDICVTNVNRQLHAVEGEVGSPKIDAMARRVAAINPECNVRPV